MENDVIFVGRWLIGMPSTSPDKNGNTVLISKKSFGPLEIWEWGLDSNDNPYECYQWLEDDFYEDESYCRNIAMDELLNQLYSIVSDLKSNDFYDRALIFENVIKKVKSL